MTAPLSHIRVLDLSRVLAGPWASQFLADMGAEVIKIERPGEGDDTRGWGPPFALEPSGGDPGLSAYFLCTNRGKKSVTVDLAHPKGQELIRTIAAVSDVAIENFKVGGLAKYGLDYAALATVNPRLVYCSITGFGQTGPYAPRAGYDFLVQGMGGLMSVTGAADGEPGGGPVKVGVAIADVIAGFNAVSAILTALVQRERTGHGEYIDVALLDCTVAALINQASTYLVAGIVPGRMGNAHPTIVPYQAFRTADGYIILAIGNDAQFQRFCAVAGLEGLAEDERYRTNAARTINRGTLIPEIAARLETNCSAEWIRRLEERGVPCGPINTIDQVFADAQAQARGLKRFLSHATAGPLPVVANPVRMASHDTTAPKAPPLLGEDTDAVLSGLLGLSAEEIAELRREGVV
jgi:crotonobetainyl-CoA:carnitine CoA-transferase CaiB-like acyl-CoA transferase